LVVVSADMAEMERRHESDLLKLQQENYVLSTVRG